MTTLREAAELALEALELAQTDVHWELHSPTRKFLRKAEKSLRAALAEADVPEADCGNIEPVQEPVAWQWLDTGTFRKKLPKTAERCAWNPLYTAPPQRKPLTDEEIRDLWSWSMTAEAERTATTQQHAFARAIEQAHGIKEGA